jgi:hypothetical protein
MSQLRIPEKKHPLQLPGIFAVLALTLTLVLSISAAYSAQVSIAWDPGTGPIAGYNVYYGVSTGQYTNSLDAGNNLSCTLQNLSSSTYYIAALDYDVNHNESGLSTELVIQPLTASAATGGSITPGGSFFVMQGANQTFNIAPNANYHIADVQVDGNSVGPVSSYTATAVSAPHSIAATFAANITSYTITASAGANGSISPSGTVSVASGAAQIFSIIPSAGYHVATVTVDGSSVGAVTSYPFSNVTANHTIAATFAVNTWTITASAGANGSISPSGTVSVANGAAQTFSIIPSAGYHVATVTVDGSSVGAVTSYPFSNVTANHTIAATFAINTWTITASAGANGSISPSGTVSVASGAAQTFTITPATGYHVATVTVDGSSVGAVTSYPFNNVTANHTIAATFAVNPYAITASAGANGSISPSGKVSVASGATQAFTITPAANHKISGVKVDGKSIGAVSSYTFTNIAANHTISASFASISYRIWATLEGGGSISPSGTLTVSSGANQAFTITPAPHYQLADVLIDGVSSGGVSSGKSTRRVSYAFTNVAADHTIKAVFARIPAPVADAGPDQAVKSGSIVTLNGSNSTDTVSGIASYKWTQVSGPRVKLSDPSAPVCTFTAPDVSSAKVLAFNLAVTSEGGVVGSASCLVNVSATGQAPAADAGADQIVSPYTNVTLDGSGSSGPNGGVASTLWVQINGPKVEIVNANTSHASFAAPDPGPPGASMVFQLQVADRFGLTTRDQCTVNVIEADQPPVANAGAGQTAAAGSSVTLDGSGSYDPVNPTGSYRWTQIRGAPVTLSDPTAITPTFTVPADSDDQSADLLFMLTVTDGNGQLSATGKCGIRLRAGE